MRRRAFLQRGMACAVSFSALFCLGQAAAAGGEIVYITAKLDLPFWATMGKGVEAVALAQGYTYAVMDSQLSPQAQLQHARDAIARGVASPSPMTFRPASACAAIRARWGRW